MPKKDSMELTPIVLFAYNRLDHLKLTINSLRDNTLAKNSELFIYSDGGKDDHSISQVKQVREYLKTIDGFKKITITERQKNWGLANSIIDGVTLIINEYNKVIVLEDDLIVSNDFLEYMNKALDFYDNDQQIWSISAYGPPLSGLNSYDKDVYLSPRGSSWGWASWKNRWEKIDWQANNFKQLKNDARLRQQFELGGNDMYKMLELQILGKIDSWAIRWCFSQFLHGKYTVYPKYSKVSNKGFDIHATHTNSKGEKWQTQVDNRAIKLQNLNRDRYIMQCFQTYHNINLVTRIGYLLRKYGGYSLAKKIIKMKD